MCGRALLSGFVEVDWGRDLRKKVGLTNLITVRARLLYRQTAVFKGQGDGSGPKRRSIASGKGGGMNAFSMKVGGVKSADDLFEDELRAIKRVWTRFYPQLLALEGVLPLVCPNHANR
jgi:hypothetical protein